MYFYSYPTLWWNRFTDIATVNILPWRSLSSDVLKKLTPDSPIGKKMLAFLYVLEERFPAFFVKHFQYPIIILTKKN